MTEDLNTIVRLEEYPIHDLRNPVCKDLLSYCKSELSEDGCCRIENFFREDAIAGVAAMAEQLKTHAHYNKDYATPYGGSVDDDLPEDHPRKIRYKRGGGFICADLLESNSPLWTFFNHHATTAFMMEALETRPLYQYADPLSCNH